jgi:hypothetical protein
MASTLATIVHGLTDRIPMPAGWEGWPLGQCIKISESVASVDRGWVIDQSWTDYKPTGTLANNTPNMRIMVGGSQSGALPAGLIDPVATPSNSSNVLYCALCPDITVGSGLSATPLLETSIGAMWGTTQATGLIMCINSSSRFMDDVQILAGDERMMLLARRQGSDVWRLCFDAGAIIAAVDDDAAGPDGRIYGVIADQSGSDIPSDWWTSGSPGGKVGRSPQTITSLTSSAVCLLFEQSDHTIMYPARSSLMQASAQGAQTGQDLTGRRIGMPIPISRAASPNKLLGHWRQVQLGNSAKMQEQETVSATVALTALSRIEGTAGEAVWVRNF